jgi:hypothetical protein
VRAPLVLAGPRVRPTLLPHAYEITIQHLFGTVTRVARARRPDEALLEVQITLEYELRLELADMPATVRRVDTGDVWMSPGSPSSS